MFKYLEDYNLVISELEISLKNEIDTETVYQLKALISNLKAQRQLLKTGDSEPSCIVISSVMSFDTETYTKMELDVEGETLSKINRPPYEKIKYEHCFIDKFKREQISMTGVLRWEDRNMENRVRRAFERAIEQFFVNNLIPVRMKYGREHKVNGSVMDYFVIDGEENEQD